MKVRLRSDVHLALTGQDLVILDLEEDVYLCLPDAVAADDLGPPQNRQTASDREPRRTTRSSPLLERLKADARDLLTDAGLVIASPDFAAGPANPWAEALPPRPSRDLRDRACGPPRAIDLVAAAGALADLSHLGRDPTTSRLLSLAGPSTGAVDEDPDRLARAAGVFATLLPWLPFEGACLRRSALLAAFLRRRGLRARWVIGVRTWPFRAHCWLQIDDILLNDDVERLAAYTPILAI